MTALTYAEAQERARLIDVREYHIGLDLTGGGEVFGWVTVVRFGCRAPGASSFAEIRPARLRRVVLNGQDVAVENPGCVTFRDEFLLPPIATRAERQLRGVVIAHEMAHMWFGDLVTMRWWNDVWLSESFAEYS